MEHDWVIYNGHEMAAGWPARIEAAQSVTAYTINGESYERIAYGKEADEWPHEACHDCGVLKGQYHVPLVCDVEQCPRCGHQVIGCGCAYEGDEEDGEPEGTGTLSP